MRGLFRISEAWQNPPPELKRAFSLILTVAALETLVYFANQLIEIEPVYALGLVRSLEGGLLILLGPWSLKMTAKNAPAVLDSLFFTGTVTVLGIAAIWIWLTLFGPPFPGLSTRTEAPGCGWLPFLFTTSIASPLAEELVFRGILYRGARTFLPAVFSTLGVSLIFSLLHLAFGGQILIPFLGSTVFCLAYEKTKHILAPLTMHVSGNLIIFLAPPILY